MQHDPSPDPGNPSCARTRLERQCGIWKRVHLWLGAGLGLFFALLGLTGSLLVFDDEIDARLNPDLLLTEHTGDSISPGEALAAIHTDADPAFQYALRRMSPALGSRWIVHSSGHASSFPKLA